LVADGVIADQFESNVAMATESDEFDCFISYARADDAGGWIMRFVAELVLEHQRLSGGRLLSHFIDRSEIRSFDDWRHRIYSAVTRSRLFIAFISPNYVASEWCRREWEAWIDTEIAKHILGGGAAVISIVEVPGLAGKDRPSEHEVARQLLTTTATAMRYQGIGEGTFLRSAAGVIKGLRRREFNALESFYECGFDAFQRDGCRLALTQLAGDLDERANLVRAAESSVSTVPPYNKRFSGRLDQLAELRDWLNDNRAGVVCGIHGLGGVGKTELAFTYAHAFASDYLGGRFLIPCEGMNCLREAVLHLGKFFHDQIREAERKTPERHLAAIERCLRTRLNEKGRILIILDNVTNAALVSPQETDLLTLLGPKLHLLATTRLAAAPESQWLTLGELSEAEALELLEKHRDFPDDAEREAGCRLVGRLGGFALAVELVAAWILVHPSTTYAQIVNGLGLDDLEDIAQSDTVELRRHNHERRLTVVLSPILRELKPAERRVLEYAALLPADYVALPWLKTLAAADFPELTQSTRLSDPWGDLCQKFERLTLLNRPTTGALDSRIVRIHRLFQDLLHKDIPADELNRRKSALSAFVRERNLALKKLTQWRGARWELEPLDALANLWADHGVADAGWLLNQVGQRWIVLAEWSRAEPLMRRALAIAEQSSNSVQTKVVTRLNNLASLLCATNRMAEAESMLRRALAIAEQCDPADEPKIAIALDNLSILLKEQNRLAEAESMMRRALAIAKRSYGPDDLKVATYLNNAAQLMHAMRRFKEAEDLMRRSLAIVEKQCGQDHPKVATRLNNLAALLQDADRHSAAEPLVRRALTIDEDSYEPRHPILARDLNNLATSLYALKRFSEAEPLMRRALEIDETCYGKMHPNVARDLNNLAILLQDGGRLEDAEQYIRRALVIDESWHGPEHSSVARDLTNLARLLETMNRPTEAQPFLARAREIAKKAVANAT
jgi:tetratricopeptide (TPR) repeat protein